jgi:hypothetical protein
MSDNPLFQALEELEKGDGVRSLMLDFTHYQIFSPTIT